MKLQGMIDALCKRKFLRILLIVVGIFAALHFFPALLFRDNRITINYFALSWNSFSDKSIANHGNSSAPDTTVVPPTVTNFTTEPDVDELQPASNSSLCRLNISYLTGFRHIVVPQLPDISEVTIEAKHPDLSPGGQWRPANCTSRERVVIIVPLRDREAHLRLLLDRLHAVLRRQQADYRIIVVEQFGDGLFNKGALLNAGYREALVNDSRDCFIFHDVDLLLENDRNLYRCASQPRHLSPAVDKFDYKLPYKILMGGVTAFTKEQFEKINGYSNLYLGWGGEDDDIFYRLNDSGYTVRRPDPSIGRYTMIRHTLDARNPQNPDRFRLLNHAKSRRLMDGLSSLNYTAVRREYRKLYTRIVADVHAPPVFPRHYQWRPSGGTFWTEMETFILQYPFLSVIMFMLIIMHVIGMMWCGCAWLVAMVEMDHVDNTEHRRIRGYYAHERI
ncbi:beta-1,4-N-acetylgalactosaminyltransferase bre-4-like [Paramacrobiotus metropolitanus]|uniref:beta-1,4-N-acetylgalactosaminyltransferase bre-4-like n=1 Tax=Paramacrobiotus metropolitanus TaxID=2943436 RepID=UPI0024463218|nr:beta-1,4-N-acetylgalactosaminyltransferase bre-4-like [Paramacrobiotus metropolitanus]